MQGRQMQGGQSQTGQQLDPSGRDARASMGSGSTSTSGSATAGMSAEKTGSVSQFVTTAARNNQLEIELGQLAAQKASNEQVQELGQKMVQHHRQATEKLTSIASKKNIEVPQTLSEQQRDEVAQFRELSGSEFDRRYTSRLVDEHKKDIQRFEQQANQGSDPEIREFARNTLPTLREHLQEAQQLQQNLKS
jgi:putative membrane protein